ncbi:cell division control protein Cdc6 [Mytilinidion resinicola]|uniref:Cell division control protein n=1 Tax=Mytilinidion resinicola TaxID=574789 RepID=A0A6A6YNA1_9PEZI|nr:cell division control protein Cdc6 [Mytilinidion resinicola]KAF2810221.1 cell division control protein Cdc6 [Mytilinidion resinicola]
MPSTVLGKRTRSSTDSPDAASRVTTRAKRQAQFVILDDGENENPFITPRNKRVVRHGDAMELDELAEDVLPSGKRVRKAGSTPAKHGAPESRVALSPAKINAHFKASKPVVRQDSKSVQATPQTPRHRDALSKKVPVTPRHRVLVGGKPLTPRTPRTPITPRHSVPTVYNVARQLFARGSAPPALFGRETERKELEKFVSTRTKGHKSGCIYVSGPPGTGKSAFVGDVCRGLQSESSAKTAYINCMSVKNASDLYRTLLEQFADISTTTEGNEVDALHEIFTKRDRSYVVTLDEVDHLLDLDLELLYRLFEWSLQRSSSLVLVGIANALDFTDRFLPRLKARGLKPQLLPFLPYTAAQIASVIISKLRSAIPTDSTANSTDFVPFIHPMAIRYLSNKVATQSGDLRKAFDICKRAIDLVEADTRDQHTKLAIEITPSPTPSPSKTPLVENINLSSPPAATFTLKTSRLDSVAISLSQITIENAPQATINHMTRITSAVFSNGATQRLQNLNLQQKAVLCALAALEKKKRNAFSESVLATPSKTHSTAPTIKAIFEAYTSLCKREDILHPLTNTEFRDIVGNLETLSLISSVEGKTGSLVVSAGTPSKRGRPKGGFGTTVVEERRVASTVANKELEAALVGPGSRILRGILDGEESL